MLAHSPKPTWWIKTQFTYSFLVSTNSSIFRGNSSLDWRVSQSFLGPNNDGVFHSSRTYVIFWWQFEWSLSLLTPCAHFLIFSIIGRRVCCLRALLLELRKRHRDYARQWAKLNCKSKLSSCHWRPSLPFRLQSVCWASSWQKIYVHSHWTTWLTSKASCPACSSNQFNAYANILFCSTWVFIFDLLTWNLDSEIFLLVAY